MVLCLVGAINSWEEKVKVNYKDKKRAQEKGSNILLLLYDKTRYKTCVHMHMVYTKQGIS